MDILALLLLAAMFVTPFFTIPLMWRQSATRKKIYRVLLGLLLAAVISGVLFVVGLLILFRNGVGFR